MAAQGIPGITETLQSAYGEMYTDALTEWRELGGKYKADNIVEVCAGRRFRKVLDCGAGEGSILKFLDASPAFDELHAIEISDSAIRQIEKRRLAKLRSVRKFNGYQIPYADREFDLVVCSHVLEHVEHPRILVRELKRVSELAVFEIPLDYSVGVDQSVKGFLSYGHINIFTPSTFKFFLKTEGYEILAERRTHTADDVTRFNWYRNQKLERTWRRELFLRTNPLRRWLRRIGKGRAAFDEFGYSAYTCLARAVGTLNIF